MWFSHFKLPLSGLQTKTSWCFLPMSNILFFLLSILINIVFFESVKCEFLTCENQDHDPYQDPTNKKQQKAKAMS